MAVPLLQVVPPDQTQPQTVTQTGPGSGDGPVIISYEMDTASELPISDSDSDSETESESGWSEPDQQQDHHIRKRPRTSNNTNHNNHSTIPITPDTPAYWPPTWSVAWPPDAVARKSPSPCPSTSSQRSRSCHNKINNNNTIKPYPIMLAKHTDLRHITPRTPCRFKFVFPLQLPPQIDPLTVPPPPYYPPNLVSNHMDGVKKVLRPVIASALLSILGPEAEPDVLSTDNPLPVIPPVTRETSFPGTWLHDNILCHMVDDPDNKLDLEAGKWEDQCGIPGEGGIDAYQDFGVSGGGVAIYYAYEFRVDWCCEDEENPAVVFFEALPELREGGRVAIIAEECDEGEREFVNMRIRDREGWP